jgi:hypothetical protein
MPVTTAEQPSSGAVDRPPARGPRPVADMVRSLAVVGVFAVALVVLVPRPNGEAVRVIDISSTVAQARADARFTVRAPVGLPERWRATSARLDELNGSTIVHLGYVTPTDQYAAVQQTDGPSQKFIRIQAGEVAPDGTVTIAGVVWVKLAGTVKAQRSLVRVDGDVTTVVVGTAPYSELEFLAANLR